MSSKILAFYIILGILLLSSVSSVLAITASIGGSRMILRAEVGEKVERYITPNNVNNVSVNVTIFISGDLEDNVELKDTSFVLQPGEEKQVYFTIFSDKDGTTETKLNVKFTPVSSANSGGVGLAATIILIAGSGGNVEDEEINEDDEGAGFNLPIGGSAVNSEGSKLNPIILLALSPIVLIVLLIFLVFYAKKRASKQGNKFARNEK